MAHEPARVNGQTAAQILKETGAPVVVFDQVRLAFDEKVVLKNISFTLISGHTKIILGASGSGKSTILKIITGLLRADAGVVWVNGERVDQLTATTIDQEIVKLRDLEHVSSIVVTHQLRDAFYVATHMAVQGPDGKTQIVPATPEKEREAEFIMLKDGSICFEGDADALRS